MAESNPPRWHALPVDRVFALVGTTRDGLTTDEVVDRFARFGGNDLPRTKPANGLIVFLRQFRSPLIYLLLLAAGLSLAIRRLADSAFILAAVAINAVIGAIQESRAEKGAHALRGIIANRVAVRRAGIVTVVDSK